MDSVAAAILASWSFEPWVGAGLLLSAVVYLKGFAQLRVQLPARFPPWRCAAFQEGLASVAVAIASPLDAFADLLLQVHMVQHWLLMMVAPPLLWLGAPAVPLLRGLPRRWLRRGVGPILAWPRLRRGLAWLTRPVVAWSLWAGTTLLWHAPFAYDAALRSRDWHDLEHATFLGASLLFWYPLMAPWPARSVPERSALVLYLGAAALFNTVFSAVFAFSTRVFYRAYLEGPRPWGLDPLADQNAAGAFMWVAASLPMLIGVVALVVSMLELRRERSAPLEARAPRRASPERPATAGWLPRNARRALALRRAAQVLLLALAAVIVADGLFGEQQPSALNLAGVLPWTWWRGIVVIGLLVVGNVFCAVCPFTLSRSLAGRWLGRRLRWPAALGGRWPAVGLFVAYLWAYEVFALWDSPFWTAWIVVGYFVVCFLIEGLFPRGSFCRHVCPIGQFDFLGAGVSPLEVGRLQPSVCAECRTHDCLRGNEAAPGCPTGLFLPTKSGSLDCTFCLDCVRACPRENAGLVAVNPGSNLGGGRSASFDVAALVLVFSFGAFANAAAMVGPVARWERQLGVWLGAEAAVVPLGLGLALVVAPAVAALVCGQAGRLLGRVDAPVGHVIVRLAPALVPVGFAMWLAHFGFHLATGLGSLGPALARAVDEAGLVPAAAPSTGMAMAMTAVPGGLEWLEGLGIAALGVGLVVSVAVAWRLALGLAPRPRRALGLAAPWALLAAVLYGAGAWILLQPMEMRGMVM